jgi:transposase
LETDPTRMCALLVGLPDVHVAAVGEWPQWLRIAITTRSGRPVCDCGGSVHGHGVRDVELVDLPVFGRPARLLWRKQRWRCTACGTTSTKRCPAIASARCVLTTRAARWATVQVGRHGRSVTEVAADLGCGWHAVMDAVELYGCPLVDDPARIGTVTALGLDETLFARDGPFRTQLWSTQIVDVRGGQLLDVVAGRDHVEPCRWLAERPAEWLAGIEWATLDLSSAYRMVFDTVLSDAVQVADPFHVCRLANQALNECRRRVQNETLGHRGRKEDPLYRARRRLTMARERLTEDGHERLMGLLRAGDPNREVWFAWNAKEVVRQIYDHTDHQLAVEWVDEIVADFADREMPPEVRRLGRTIARWREQIVAWHRSHVSNGPTEAVNNLVKRVKRVAFGMRNFPHYRIRALLYAGRPNWALLDTITPP